MKILSTAQCSLSDDVERAYLTDQLIAYIGNKRKLLGLIRQAIHQTGLESGVFFDAFVGSGSVTGWRITSGFRLSQMTGSPTRGLSTALILPPINLPCSGVRRH